MTNWGVLFRIHSGFDTADTTDTAPDAPDSVACVDSVRAASRKRPGPDHWTEEHEERAAIATEGSEAPSAWAEALAGLNPDLAPGNIPLRRWKQFVDDAGRFLDGGWAVRADALGWSPLNLFGCDRNKPFARIDHQGLLWLLNGRRLVELRADAAAIETQSGAQLTFRRCLPNDPKSVVLPWELAL
jgi:hypothetical protein